VAQSWGRSQLKPGDEVLVSAMEHHANIVPWQMVCEATGALLKVLPMNEQGVLQMDQLPALLGPRTRLVAVTQVSNALGTINPVAEIIRQARQVGALVLLDGAQAVSHLSVDVTALDCDFYAFSGHKLYGPTGIGVLYGKKELLNAMPPWQGGGDMIRTVSFEKSTWNDLPYKFEAGTPHIAGGIGLGAAIDFVTRVGLSAIAKHEDSLLAYAMSRVPEIASLRVVGTSPDKAAVLSFVMKGVHPHDIGTILDREGVAIRTGHHCAMPVMTFFKVAATARASFALYNNRQDVDALFAALNRVEEMFLK
jgi:cysteine desulfurase/selenocysteine lyase